MFWKTKQKKIPPLKQSRRNKINENNGDNGDDNEHDVVESVISCYKEDDADEVEVEEDVEEDNEDDGAPSDEDRSHEEEEEESSNDDDDEDEDEDDEENEDGYSMSLKRRFCFCFRCNTTSCVFLGNVMFLFGATLYTFAAYYVLDYYQTNNVVPRDYAIDEEGDTTTSLSTTTSILFQVNDKNASSSSTVTEYMAFSFAAMLCFFLSGTFHMSLCGRNQNDNKYNKMKTCNFITILAALWGMASSALIIQNKYLSQIFDSVSMHLFALQAIGMLCFVRHNNSRQRTGSIWCCGCTSAKWLRLADWIFIFGTLSDVLLTYFVLWQQELLQSTQMVTLHWIYASVGAAACFWLYGLLYLIVPIMEDWKCCSCCCGRNHKYCYDDNDSADVSELEKNNVENEQDDDEESQTISNNYIPHKSLGLKQDFTEETTNEDEDSASVLSLWTAGPGPTDKRAITRSSLDDIFGRAY